MKTILCGSMAVMALLAGAVQADFIHDDDVLIGVGKAATDNLCVGSDCADGEVFGNENIKIKEESPSLMFEDTDAGDPSWMIEINRGTEDTFELLDLQTGTIPFEVEVAAPNAALYVNGGNGDIGFGTALPQKELHVVDSAIPTLRLEQDSTIIAHIWDIEAGNLSIGFRDVSNSRSPFSVQSNAPTASLFVETGTGDVGFGTNVPDAPVHVVRANGTARVHVQETNITPAARELFLMSNNGGSYFTLRNTSTGKDWFFTHENNVQGRFIITSSITPNLGMFFESDGDMKIGGTLTQNSDKNVKMAIEPVDPAEVLAKVTALPVSAWTYKHDEQGARHMGPMAQDFHALFGLGATETGISTLDTSGVALAAIQALAAENAALRQEMAELRALIGVDD